MKREYVLDQLGTVQTKFIERETEEKRWKEKNEQMRSEIETLKRFSRCLIQMDEMSQEEANNLQRDWKTILGVGEAREDDRPGVMGKPRRATKAHTLVSEKKEKKEREEKQELERKKKGKERKT